MPYQIKLWCFTFIASLLSANDAFATGTTTSNICGIRGAANELVACPSPSITHGNSSPYEAESGFWGSRSDPGVASIPIHAFNKCRYVDNTGTNGLFVPYRTEMEWLAFIDRFTTKPDVMTLSTCALPLSVTIPPNAACLSPSPSGVSYNLGYGRTNTTTSRTATFTCCSASGCGAGQQWTQTAVATYLALNSDVDTPSWKLTNLTYSGAPPAPTCTPTSQTQTLACPAGYTGTWTQKRDYTCPAATWGAWYDTAKTCTVIVPVVNGKCGSLNGITNLSPNYPRTTILSSSNSCAVGTLDNVHKAGRNGGDIWAWTCLGKGGGSNASCWAQQKEKMHSR